MTQAGPDVRMVPSRHAGPTEPTQTRKPMHRIVRNSRRIISIHSALEGLAVKAGWCDLTATEGLWRWERGPARLPESCGNREQGLESNRSGRCPAGAGKPSALPSLNGCSMEAAVGCTPEPRARSRTPHLGLLSSATGTSALWDPNFSSQGQTAEAGLWGDGAINLSSNATARRMKTK